MERITAEQTPSVPGRTLFNRAVREVKSFILNQKVRGAELGFDGKIKAEAASRGLKVTLRITALISCLMHAFWLIKCLFVHRTEENEKEDFKK